MPGPSGMRSGRRDVAIRSWPGFGRSGATPGREVPAAVGDTGSGGAARERRGSGDRRAPSPIGLRCGPALTGLRPSGLGIKSRAELMSAPPARRRASSRPDSPPAPGRPRHSGAPRSSEPTSSLSPRLATGRRRQPSRRAWVRRVAVAWLLALATLPFAPVPASAQTEIWSTTLTAGTAAGGAIGYIEEKTGVLGSTTFELDDTTYRVFALATGILTGLLSLELYSAIADIGGLALQLNDNEYRLGDAAYSALTPLNYHFSPL